MNATALLVLFALHADPAADLKSKLDAVSRQLSSKKQADVIAGLEAAGKLGKDASPLIRPICEHVFGKNDEVAGAGADAIKAIAPDIYETVLKLRKFEPLAAMDPNAAGVIFSSVKELGEYGEPLAWLVRVHMVQLFRVKARIGPTLFDGLVSNGFKALVAAKDMSDEHWQLVLRCRMYQSLLCQASYESFLKADPAKHLAHVKELIARQTSYSLKDIEQIISIGKEAKGALPKLRSMSKLNPNKEIRDAALAAIEAIEADIKKPMPK